MCDNDGHEFCERRKIIQYTQYIKSPSHINVSFLYVNKQESHIGIGSTLMLEEDVIHKEIKYFHLKLTLHQS